MRMNSNAGQSNPVNVFHGFIYWYRLYTEKIDDATLTAEIELDGTNNCNLGPCSNCPTVNGSICLWTVARNYYFDGDEHICDNSYDLVADNDCTMDQGCVRGEDCNRCDDERCEDCINFDSDGDKCI